MAALPRSTRTRARRSPTRSCQPTTVYSPGGTSGSSNVPSTEGIVKYGWSSTRIVALMCEWMWQYTFTMPDFGNCWLRLWPRG